jgi:hypothetical protein
VVPAQEEDWPFPCVCLHVGGNHFKGSHAGCGEQYRMVTFKTVLGIGYCFNRCVHSFYFARGKLNFCVHINLNRCDVEKRDA